MIEKARDDGEHAATPADVAIPLTPTDLLRLPRSEAADERLIAAANHRRLEIAAARRSRLGFEICPARQSFGNSSMTFSCTRICVRPILHSN